MKKSYILLAAICLILSIVLSIQSPITSKSYFILNGNALAEDIGFETSVGMNYEENQTVLQETNDKIDKQISKEITKQSDTNGAGKSFGLNTIELNSNIANNIGEEDPYQEVLEQELNEEFGETPKFDEEEKKETEKETEKKIETKPNKSEVKYKKLANSNQLESFDPDASNVTYMGNYKLTAYCPCTKCCGSYGANRPVDENGYTIVGTSSGARAYANHTIAVDPSVIPYGTVVIIERNGVYYEYVAEDCGGAIKNNRIDVYFDSHSTACDFGVRYGNVYIIK